MEPSLVVVMVMTAIAVISSIVQRVRMGHAQDAVDRGMAALAELTRRNALQQEEIERLRRNEMRASPARRRQTSATVMFRDDDPDDFEDVAWPDPTLWVNLDLEEVRVYANGGWSSPVDARALDRVDLVDHGGAGIDIELIGGENWSDEQRAAFNGAVDELVARGEERPPPEPSPRKRGATGFNTGQRERKLDLDT